MPQARSALFAARPLISAALALLLAGGVLPGPTVAARTVVRATGAGGRRRGVGGRGRTGRGTAGGRERSCGAPDGAAQHPSIAYEQAMAHADDRSRSSRAAA